MTIDTNVFDGPGLPLLLELEQGGFDLAVRRGELWVRPVHQLTAEQQSQIQEHRSTLVALVCDAGVRDRVEAFRAQLEADPKTIGPFIFRAGVPYAKGTCFSCGACLPDPCFGRCWRCSLAWRFAYGLPVPDAVAAAHNDARLLA